MVNKDFPFQNVSVIPLSNFKKLLIKNWGKFANENKQSYVENSQNMCHT